jgi:hypothetical protein
LPRILGIIASLVLQLSTVIVDIFLSRFYSNKCSIITSAITLAVCGAGTYINLK